MEVFEKAKLDRGRPRVYIQQFFDLRLPEDEYLKLVAAAELDEEEDPFDEVAAGAVMETYLEYLGEGGQYDTVHIERGDGQVALLTVVSLPYSQAQFEELLEAHRAKETGER